MRSQLSYIEFSGNSYEFNNIPSFTNDVWPLFLKNLSSIESVYEVRSSKKIWERITGRKVENEIIQLGPMGLISSDGLDRIKYLSYYAGHLTVFYKTSDDAFINSLISMYKHKGKLFLLGENIGLTASKLIFINSIAYPDVLISFAHDGNPMFIFGNEKKLREIESVLAGGRF